VHHEKYSYPNDRWSGHVQTIQNLTSGGENSIRVGIEEVIRICDRQKAKAVPWSKAACMSWLLTVGIKEIKLRLIVVPTDDWQNLELGGNFSIDDSDSRATNINSG
jgi:hypothetical protein